MARPFRIFRTRFLLESKAGQYLAFAVGEVILIIIGILIALQVNNWNVERIELRRVRELAHALITDLESDIADLERILLQMRHTLKNVEALSDHTRGKTLDQIDNLDLSFQISTMGYRPYEWHRATIEVLKTTGALSNIRNPELATLLTRYEVLTHHLDSDYEGDYERVRATQTLAAELVDGNYPDSEEATSFFRKSLRDQYEFPPRELHEIYKGHELRLLTDDMNRIKMLTNIANQVGQIGARVEHEVPGAVSMARKLIELLKAEYPE
jgi:hypothetical protein